MIFKEIDNISNVEAICHYLVLNINNRMMKMAMFTQLLGSRIMDAVRPRDGACGICMTYGTAKAEIVARIPGQEVEGRGTLCSLSRR